MVSRLPLCIGVVDDDESYSRSLERLLRAASYRTVTYLSAESFMADTGQPPLDCLLCDIELPGISGIELQRRLVALGSTTPVIYITAHDDPVTRRAALAVGCEAFISKVEPSDNLLETIARIFNRPPRLPS